MEQAFFALPPSLSTMRKIIRGRWLIEKKFKAETQGNLLLSYVPHQSVGGNRSLDQRGKNLVVKGRQTSEQALGRVTANRGGKGPRESAEGEVPLR